MSDGQHPEDGISGKDIVKEFSKELLTTFRLFQIMASQEGESSPTAQAAQFLGGILSGSGIGKVPQEVVADVTQRLAKVSAAEIAKRESTLILPGKQRREA